MSSRERCDILADLQKRCPKQDIVNPRGNLFLIKNLSLSLAGANVDSIVQLMPQEIDLVLRPYEPQEINVKFRQAEDYPVDLYFLMDLSNSMSDDKKNLESLGMLLNTEMVKITRNFRLGFGSFVDKVTMPYVNTHPMVLDSPCDECAAPYGFHNHMALSKDADSFVQRVANAPTSGNLDNPEGTFDAMMQSIVCTHAIGWREKARRILLVATDAGFHFAGDGKLGGIVVPNDCHCHLDRHGRYNMSTSQDYPSISQICEKARDNNINVLFAVTANEYGTYRELSSKIDGSHTGQLTENSDNIVELIKQQYEKITSKVELKDSISIKSSNYIKVSYQSKCLSGKLEETNVCNGLKIGTTVEFTVKVEVIACPTDPKERIQSFGISPVGLNETLVVRVEIICECDCEKPEKEIRRSSVCSNIGTYQCGVCSCPKDRVGQLCQCDSRKLEIDSDESKCRKDNSSVLCSGRGICTCGQCFCYPESVEWKRVDGDFCECDNFNCQTAPNELMCAGHGKCDCRQCICDRGWTGEDCYCPSAESSCMAPNGEICSGKGRCDCGVCQCDRYFGGLLCEQNFTPGARCADLSACVSCVVFARENISRAECNDCSHSVELLEEAVVEKEGEHRCQVKDDRGCQYFFVYMLSMGGSGGPDLQIRAQNTTECPPPVNVALVSMSVIGSIVAIGVCLLLAWKVVTEVHDRREFVKFEKERQLAKWGKADNPIYKPTVSTFSNPTYGESDTDG